MKPLLISILFAVFITGCAKTNNAEDPTPVARFNITNTVESGTVAVSTTVEFENNSQNADSYEWDFGDGTVSTERVPRGIIFRQCNTIRQIRLTVRTRRGRSAATTQTIRIRC